MFVFAIAAAAAGCLAAPLSAQNAAQNPQEAVDFTKAMVAEVRNAQGQVVLTGKFVVIEEEDDDIERKATLTPTSVDADALGEAEVEVDRTGNPRRQEVEFSVANVQPGAVFTLLIDGRVVATVTADSRGRASHERDVPMPVNRNSP
jgi:hypothetical protein